MNPILEAIRLLRQNWHIVADDCGYEDGHEMRVAADALEAYFTEPADVEVERLTEQVRVRVAQTAAAHLLGDLDEAADLEREAVRGVLRAIVGRT